MSFDTRVTPNDYLHYSIRDILLSSYHRISCVINSTSEYFQKRISVLLQGIEGVVYFMDDILIVKRDQQEHDSRLHAVLRRLMDANVTLNSKLENSVLELKYVGLLVSSAGVKIDPQIAINNHQDESAI